MNTPLVSISCITYNHAPYIRECLEGFLMQKTNFPFEVLIHDDASTDGTADIIREYQKKYPDIVKPILQTENQYSKGVCSMSATFNFPRAQGKYIALCEGDDFWNHPLKLQTQFDFMEAHPDYSLCMHWKYLLDCIQQFYMTQSYGSNFPSDSEDYKHRLILGETLYATQTMFFRKDSFELKREDILHDSKDAPMGDTQLAFHLASVGKVKLIKRYFSTYRKASGSATSPESQKKYDIFLKKYLFSLKKLAIRNGYETWWNERCKLFEKKTSKQQKSLRYLLGALHLKIKKTYGRFMFNKYVRCSAQERVHLRLLIH